METETQPNDNPFSSYWLFSDLSAMCTMLSIGVENS